MSLPLFLLHITLTKTDCIGKNKAQHISVYIVAMISWLEIVCYTIVYWQIIYSSTTNEHLPIEKQGKLKTTQNRDIL